MLKRRATPPTGGIPQPSPTWLERKRGVHLRFNLVDESTIAGVVLEVGPDGVLLGAAEYLGDQSVPLGGEVFLPKERVAFIQVPPRTGA